MFQLGWFRKSVLVILIVALTTTLPLPFFDILLRPVSIYAASDGQSIAHSSPLSEALDTTNALADALPPEMANALPGMSLFGANGEPEGVLMDVGAIEAALNSAPDSPDSLANPLSISRAQSAYQPGAAIDNQLTITFTVTNNRPPAIVPQVPVSATITDSIAIMSEFDYANDPNTIRNVMVVDALTDQATYIASSPLPDQDGATSAWNLGDIAPLSSTSFTMTQQVPTSVSDFTDLDTGATAWGTLQGRQVTAQSSPATLTPETINGEAIGDWLQWTVDADIYDEYMLEKAAEIGQAPETLFAYVRSLGYESYSGSLRGTRGTIWSEAGNSLDQASLLIAMLRTSGIPARYRHGTLETNRAQELILSMFPEPTRVIGHDGTLTWRHNLNYPLPPLLADLTGDGRLDILTASGNTLYLFDYALTPPAIVWQRTFTNTLDGRGTPAIADVDGLLPGGDEGPEIALVEDGFIHLVDADGSVIWSYATGEGAPGGVSIADTDGDGEVEILASAQVDGGRLYVLNADGSLLWHAPAQDSTSANSGSVLDLDGDGIWEIIWNGFEQGLTIFRGSDGEIIFNEPFINSSTRMDYPIIADVDGDKVAEIVTGDDDGLYVVGFDVGWAPSRPLWNQYNYHITNIRNDLSVPEVEPDSWVSHNTYRTQTPIEDPFAGYQVDLTHTIAESGMEVLPDSFSAPPDTPAPSYHWSYEQLSPSYTTSFDAVLPDMQPGEVRQISQGTQIDYQLGSGTNQLTLPPLYVAAAHIIAIEPVSQTTTTGSRGIYDVTFKNPTSTQATYTLAANGLPEGWVNLPQTVNLSPDSEMTLPMTITVPTGAELDQYDFSVAVDNGIGGQDQVGASLIVADLLDITLKRVSENPCSFQRVKT